MLFWAAEYSLRGPEVVKGNFRFGSRNRQMRLLPNAAVRVRNPILHIPVSARRYVVLLHKIAGNPG
jgi:hypothetical protein